jgi:hypothetical protein
MGAGLVVSVGFAPAGAHPMSRSALSRDRETPLVISVDMDHETVRTGESIEFETVVKNRGEEESPALVVAMNIVNLGSGDPVDPEDWSPERTQSIDPLAPHESATNPWIVDAILDGDYMVYIVVIPSPDGPETTSQPLASSGIHLSVTKFIRLNPEGVLPIALAMPIVLTLCMIGLRWIRGRRYG